MNGKRKPYYKRAHYRRSPHGNYVLRNGQYIRVEDGAGTHIRVKGKVIGESNFPKYPLMGNPDEVPIDRMSGKDGR